MHANDIHMYKHFYSINFRNRLGRNDNPSTVEFQSAFKKLFVCHPLLTSVGHNVISNATGILTASSRSKNKLLTLTPQAQDVGIEFELVNEMELGYEHTMMNEIESMDPYEQHMCAYLALCIEEEFLKNTINQHRYGCKRCVDVLSDADNKINDEFLAMKGEESKQPSTSTLKIVIFSNAVMKIYSTIK